MIVNGAQHRRGLPVDGDAERRPRHGKRQDHQQHDHRQRPEQLAAGFLSTATQEVGFAKGNGSVENSTVIANGASNTAAGFLSTARQQIGGAARQRQAANSTVIASGSVNTAAGFLSTADQSIGVAK